jgi:hypothetical protein
LRVGFAGEFGYSLFGISWDDFNVGV